jgi:hypothetical protein
MRLSVTETCVQPQTVSTDKAATYPPALAVVLPESKQLVGKWAQATA